MDAGNLNTRITIKRLSKTADSFGGYTSTESTLKSIWAYKTEVSGDVKMENGKRSRYLNTDFTVRKKSVDNVTINDLIYVDDETQAYRINNIVKNDTKDFVVIKGTKNE